MNNIGAIRDGLTSAQHLLFINLKKDMVAIFNISETPVKILKQQHVSEPLNSSSCPVCSTQLQPHHFFCMAKKKNVPKQLGTVVSSKRYIKKVQKLTDNHSLKCHAVVKATIMKPNLETSIVVQSDAVMMQAIKKREEEIITN